MRDRCRIALFLVGVLLLSIGCATKNFVREELEKSETKVDGRVGKLETDLDQEKGRVGGVMSQVTEVRSLADEARGRGDQAAARAEQASAKAEQAAGKAEQAAGRADQASGVAGQALAKAEETDSRLGRLWANRFKRNPVDTVMVTFGFDKWELNDQGQTALLEVARQLKENLSLFVDLEGYTDNRGPAPYNVQLSQRRVEAVRRFLVEKGVELSRIQSIGLGDAQPAADNKTREGRSQNRRVVIKVYSPAD